LVVAGLRPAPWCPFLLISIELMLRDGSYAGVVAFIEFCGCSVFVPSLFRHYTS
jgi:hypothetical protein